MSLQLAFGFNAMSPVVAKMVTDRMLMTARIHAQHDIATVCDITRESAAYHLLYEHLQDNSRGFPTLETPLVDELRRMHPDAADTAADAFHDWFHDC